MNSCRVFHSPSTVHESLSSLQDEPIKHLDAGDILKHGVNRWKTARCLILLPMLTVARWEIPARRVVGAGFKGRRAGGAPLGKGSGGRKKTCPENLLGPKAWQAPWQLKDRSWHVVL